MSCQINLFSNCGDIERIKRALYLLNRDDLSWLKECRISFSSCGSMIAVSYGRRVCFLSAQWIASSSSNVYLVSWNGSFDHEITSVFASPICSQGHSSQSVPDWICVMIGTQNGEINFYTDQGHFLMKEHPENGPVKKIACHTGIYGNEVEEIHVVYQTVICIIQGSSLFQTLRYIRSQLAKVAKAGLNNESQIDGRSIQIRKWLFTDQETVSDCAVVGLDVSNTFDHLLSASMYGGYDTIFRSIPPHNTLILAGGIRPFIGFHYALEGGVQPPLQDVAKAVASKIISNLPIIGWFGSNKSTTKDNNEKQYRAESLVLRSSINDISRQCISIILSPDRRLAAITDNLGRVSLVDLKCGLIIRIFKGYRNAQCAFVHVFDEKQKNSPSRMAAKQRKYALFLIIYTPKKGLIDIRLMSTGVRVASFTTSTNGILLYNTSGLLGTSTAHSSKVLNTPQYQCVLVDPDGTLKRFYIPFHFALEGENSKSAKDIHLLRRLRQLTKDVGRDVDKLKVEIINTVKELETIEVKKYCIEQVIADRHIPPICILICAEIMKKSLEGNDGNEESVQLKLLCDGVCKLCRCFMHLNNLDMENYSCECCDVLKLEEEKVINLATKDLVTEEVSNELDKDTDTATKSNEDMNSPTREKDYFITLSPGDLQNLQRLLDLSENNENTNKDKNRVTFVGEDKTSYAFINCFQNLDDATNSIGLKPSLSQDDSEHLAFEIFNTLFNETERLPLRKWRMFVKCGNLNPHDLVKLLVTYWMTVPLSDNKTSEKMFIVGHVFYEISILVDENVYVSYNELSPWSEYIRGVLVEASPPIKSMMLAMMCKEVAQIIEKERDTAGDAHAWENITKDGAKWSLLIGKLEDIALLSIILSKYPAIKNRSLPVLELATPDINLNYIYNSGKGIISELVGKWLCVVGESPKNLRLDELKQNFINIPVVTSNDSDGTLPNFQEEEILNYERMHHNLFDKLDLLRKQFPYSTQSNYLILNMCWEYASAWIKNVESMQYLEAVLLCLENITCPFLTKGLCSLVWSTHLKRIFDSACKLLNKVGKLPKERLCLQDVGLSDSNVVNLLRLVTEFLNKSMASLLACEKCVRPPLKFEKIWDKSVPAFSEIVLDSPTISYDMQLLIFQVASVLYYQCFLNVKFSKPLNMLFDCDLHALFESSVQNYTLPDNSFSKVRSQRLRFIKKLILASVDLVSSVNGDAGRVLHSTEMSKWMDKIYELARIWGIDDDFLRREQAVGLYELGYDQIAEDIFRSVEEPSEILPNMAILCGTRLRYFYESSPDVSSVIASLPPQLMAYLQCLDLPSGSFSDVSIELTKKLLENIISRCGSNPSVDPQQMRMITLMLEACNVMGSL